MELSNPKVAHRTTLFEDNNVVFTVYKQSASMADAGELEPGHRATWDRRNRLCVAKLAKRLTSGLHSSHFADFVLEQGPTARDDRFVELHIWGSLTIRSVARVRIHRKRRRPLKAAIADVRRLLKDYHVALEEL